MTDDEVSIGPCVPISDAPHAIEADWKASFSPTTLNGSVSLWIDGLSKGSQTGIDNDTKRVDEVRLGAVNGLDAGTSGTIYLDKFEARRFTYIGP